MRVVLVANIHGQTERHIAARRDWPKDAILRSEWGRDARDIGNDRPVPYLRDLLLAGLEAQKDVIVWSNDDVSFAPGAFEKFARHCQVFEFGCCRREPGHCGREAFFFLSSWLREHIDQMPDVLCCTERFDLVLARWLHKFHGHTLHERNWLNDVFPVEIAPGLVHHEPHTSYWTKETYRPAAMHNLRLWKEMA